MAERALLHETDALRALVAACETHVSRPEITQPACRALRNMAVRPAAQRPAVAAGAIDAALRAMDAAPATVALQISACGFLKNVAAMSAHGRDAVRASAAIPKLVATAERNKAASDVQNQAGLALFYIIGADHQQPEEPDPTWRQVALDAGADARWLDGIKHRLRMPDESEVDSRFPTEFAKQNRLQNRCALALVDKTAMQEHEQQPLSSSKQVT